MRVRDSPDSAKWPGRARARSRETCGTRLANPLYPGRCSRWVRARRRCESYRCTIEVAGRSGLNSLSDAHHVLNTSSLLSGGSRNKTRSREIREACFLVYARVQPPGSPGEREGGTVGKTWLAWAGAIVACGVIGVASHWNDPPARAKPAPEPVTAVPPPVARPAAKHAIDPALRISTAYDDYVTTWDAYGHSNAWDRERVACGLNTLNWLQRAQENGDRSMKQPLITELGDKLTSAQRERARAHGRQVEEADYRKFLENPQRGCADLADGDEDAKAWQMVLEARERGIRL